MRTALPLLLLAVAGCKVVDAPENLEELMVFGFQHFEDERDDALVDMFTELVPLVDTQTEALAEGYRINNLAVEDLEDAGIADVNVENVLGAMGQADYRHGLDDVLFGVTIENKDEVYDTFLSYEISNDTDLACFLAHECSDYRFHADQTVSVTLLGESTQSLDQIYRRVETEDGEFVISRVLSPDGVTFNSNIVAVDQQYQLFVLYPEGTGTRRVEAFWVEARVIGMDVPDSFAVDNFAKSVGNQAERVDEFLDTQ